MFPRPIAKARPAVRVAYKASLPVALLVWLLPLVAVALTSIRGAGDLARGNYWGWPGEFDLVQNYRAVFVTSPIGLFILNSFRITVPVVAASVALACMAGYALAVYRFRANSWLFFLFVGGNFVPFQILMVPVRDLTLRLGLYDTTLGLILFHSAFQTGFCTLFMRNFISSLPHELIEAARVEGVGEWSIFLRVVMPLMRPAIAALSVLIFTFVWNDYFWALVLIQGNHAMPVTAGLNALNGEWVSAWNLVSAGAIVAAMPPVAMFFLMQKHFIAGLTLGATKG
ncbi:MAG: carbohydrate ABC transporter permease [Hyphomicrobiales bacterium]|nr:carbohydrate ABC transporter permease [Hyphomicrobiales bacterium]MDE2017585.1 carbohydrate ABC transporter permease [Hyphomicrobiales bacterium]